MDMWGPSIASVKERLPGAESMIAFDKFQVASHLGKAVDDVRRAEHRTLAALGGKSLEGTRFALLTNPDNMSFVHRATIHVLQGLNLEAARDLSPKAIAMDIWRYVSRRHAGAALREWTSRAMRSRLEPMKRCARMIREHLWGIVNAMASGVTNACSESFNAQVQRV